VTGQDGWVVSVKMNIILAHDVERHLGPVFGGGKLAHDLDVVETGGRRHDQGGRARAALARFPFIPTGWDEKAFVVINQFVALPAKELADRRNRQNRQLRPRTAIEGKEEKPGRA